jgi:hypothetical protein
MTARGPHALKALILTIARINLFYNNDIEMKPDVFAYGLRL